MNLKSIKTLAIILSIITMFGTSTLVFAGETNFITNNMQLPPEKSNGEMPDNMQDFGHGDNNGMFVNKFTDIEEDA